MSRTARYSFMGTRGGSGHAALPCISARFVSGPYLAQAALWTSRLSEPCDLLDSADAIVSSHRAIEDPPDSVAAPGSDLSYTEPGVVLLFSRVDRAAPTARVSAALAGRGPDGRPDGGAPGSRARGPVGAGGMTWRCRFLRLLVKPAIFGYTGCRQMDSQGWLTLAAVVVPTLAVAFTAWLNHNAHKGITNRIDGVDDRAVRRDEAHHQALESIARDVSFMAGRQTERDQAAPPPRP